MWTKPVWAPTIVLAVALGIAFPATLEAQTTAVAKSKPPRSVARRTIVVHFAELNPENFVHSEPRREADEAEVPDDTEFLEQARRKTQVRQPKGVDFKPIVESGPPPPGPPEPPPTPPLVVGPIEPPSWDGYDPQVAAGMNYVAAIASHKLTFYDKAGKQLTETIFFPLPKPPIVKPYLVRSYDLFQTFMHPTEPDGSVNPTNINLSAGFPPNPKLPCNLTDPAAQQACIDEVFDLRVAYDSKHDRFIFVGDARNSIWGCTNYASSDCDPTHSKQAKMPNPCSSGSPNAVLSCNEAFAKLARRYTFVAITKDKDPRKGFYTWSLDRVGDWPSVSVNGSHLLITLNSICDDTVTCPPKSTYPAIYVISTDDLASGKSQPSIWPYWGADMNYPFGLRPVVSRDAGAPDYFVAPNGNSMQIWASKDPTKPLQTASVNLQLTNDPDYFIRGVVLWSGKLYYTYSTGPAADCLFPDKCPRAVRLLATALTWKNGLLAAAKAQLPNGKPFDITFGTNGPGDDPSDVVSYEMPSLDVTESGDAVVAYTRRPIKVAGVLNSEARYSVLYHNESSMRPSAVLKKGEALVDTPAGIDLAVQALDPSDGSTVWLTHVYGEPDKPGKPNIYGMAIGSVKP